MATIKSYTDISQSKKLAKILPLESADMYWMHGKLDKVKQYPTPYIIGNALGEPLWDEFDLPCWSLVALLNVLPQGYSLGNKKSNGKYYICMTCVKHDVIEYDNPIDACIEMIEMLHELNLL